MSDDLRVTTDEGDVIYVELCPHKTPTAYQRKMKELTDSGMTDEEAENHLLRPIPLEIFYSKHQGLFGVESECLDCCEIYNPYTGKEIPNDNL